MTEKVSYKGMVGFSRINGSKRLYMSNLNNSNWIALRVYEAKDDSKDWGEKRVTTKSSRPLVELELSASQFAELLTTMNVGNGVPCTLTYAKEQRIDQTALKEDDSPLDVGKKFFKKNAKEFSDEINRITSDLSKELEDIKMSKKSKDRVEAILSKVRQEVCANMPFYVEVFEETAKKVVDESKAEIDAFVTGGIVKAGLEALGIKGHTLLDDGEHAVVKSDEY